MLAALGVLGTASTPGCRKFELCGADGRGCGQLGDGGSTSGGGTECSEPWAECDESSLTACETDTSRDLQHCGGCTNRCDGACSDGRCIELKRIAEDGVVDAGLAASTEHVYFFEEVAGTTVLRRLAKGDGVVSTLLENLGAPRSFTGIAAGTDRVYFVMEGALKSTPLTGTPKIMEEGVATDVAPVVTAGHLYAWTRRGTLLRRSLAAGDPEEIEPWDHLPSEAELAVSGGRIVAGATVLDGGQAGWELRFVDWPSSTRLAGGRGRLTGVRTMPASDMEVVWLVDRSESGEPSELHAFSALDGVRRIATETVFTDFCLSTDLVYASFERPREHGLRALSPTNPTYAEVPFRPLPEKLLCDDGFVYVYALGGSLLRVSMGDLSPSP